MRFYLIAFHLLAVLLLDSAVATPTMWRNWRWLNPQPMGRVLRGIAASETTVVAVGNGVAVVSDDLMTWELVATGRNMRDVVWTGNLFAAVGDRGFVYTSPDGREWTERHQTSIQYFNKVIVGGGTILAVGVQAKTATSTDGLQWTDHVLDENLIFGMTDVAWNGSVFVAMDGYPEFNPTTSIYASEDGTEWTNVTPGGVEGRYFNSIMWDGSQFLIFNSAQGAVFFSTDGWNWNEASTDSVGGILDAVKTPEQYFGVGRSGRVFASTDGLSWSEEVIVPNESSLFDIARFQRSFVAIGASGAIITSSDNGVSWEAVTHYALDLGWNEHIKDICWAQEGLIALAPRGQVFKSVDEETWQNVMTFPGPVNAVGWFDEAYWIAGDNGLITRSTDGVMWTTQAELDDKFLFGIAGNGAVAIACGARPAGTAVFSVGVDGESWTDLDIDDTAGAWPTAIAWTGERFVAVGAGSLIFLSDDGNHWETIELGGAWGLVNLASNGHTLIAVNPSNLIVSEDGGFTWENNSEVPGANDIAWTGETFVATTGEYTDEQTMIYTSRDGRNWIASEVGGGCVFGEIASNGRRVIATGFGESLMKVQLIIPEDSPVEQEMEVR